MTTAQKTPAQKITNQDPFHGWETYKRRGARGEFARIGRNNALYFSAKLTQRLGITKSKSADLYYSDNKLGIKLFNSDDQGKLKVGYVKRQAIVSMTGAVKQFGLEKHVGSRFYVEELTADCLVINLNEIIP